MVTYKTSGIFNFGHGAIASLSVFIYYDLHHVHGWSWPLAAIVALLVTGPFCGVLMELLARRLADSSEAQKIAGTLGIYVLVVAIGDLWFGPDTLPVSAVLPTGTFHVAGVAVGWDQLITTLVALGLTALLFAYFRLSQTGLRMRAVVDDAALVAMTGSSPVRTRRVAWMIGNTFASISGLLLAPSIGVSGILLTSLVVQALGAAAIGYLSNIPLTFLGGLVIGIAGALSTKYSVTHPSLLGLPAALPFIILFVVLIATPRRKLASKRFSLQTTFSDSWHAGPRVRVLFGVVVVALLVWLPHLDSIRIASFSLALIAVLMFLSAGLLVRVAGQVSLCQYAFAAIGAAATARFSTSAHLPWLLALALGVAVAIPIGALVAIPALRLSGIFLALATLGLGLFLETLVYTSPFMFGSSAGGVNASRPRLSIGGLKLDGDYGYYYVILVVIVIAAVLVELLTGSRLGRLLKGLRESPIALETNGLSVRASVIVVFCISTALAALAGGLTAGLFQSASGSSFPSFSSLVLLLIVMIIPYGGPWYAVVGAAALEIVPAYVTSTRVTDYLNVLFGISAILAVYTAQRYRGVPQGVRRFAEDLERKLGGARPRPTVEQTLQNESPSQAAVEPTAVEQRLPQGTGLRVSGVNVQYGGRIAVQGLSIDVPYGQIIGLIGPNGAGKTSTFNACSGLLKPTGGTIELDGRSLGRRGVASRARSGLGRTFQRVELARSLTVAENIAFGYECALVGSNPLRQIYGGRHVVADTRAAVSDAADFAGLPRELLQRRVAEISTGQRRLVELARLIAGGFKIVLLDEPSSGLDSEETEFFGTVVQRLVTERGVGVLLVEHDIDLVSRLCDTVYVLDFGLPIYQGPPEDMMHSDAVRAAYLGSLSTETADAVAQSASEPSAQSTTGVTNG